MPKADGVVKVQRTLSLQALPRGGSLAAHPTNRRSKTHRTSTPIPAGSR